MKKILGYIVFTMLGISFLATLGWMVYTHTATYKNAQAVEYGVMQVIEIHSSIYEWESDCVQVRKFYLPNEPRSTFRNYIEELYVQKNNGSIIPGDLVIVANPEKIKEELPIIKKVDRSKLSHNLK